MKPIDPAKIREKIAETKQPATIVNGDVVIATPPVCHPHMFSSTADDPTVRCINCGKAKEQKP
jgi:hypothetical protein